MNIYTAHWKHSNDDYYAPHNRRMFLNRKDADAFLTDLMDYEHIERYYVLEEDVLEEYVPMDYEIICDWECSFGTLHTHDDICTCDEYGDNNYDDEYCDYHNDFESRYYDELNDCKEQEISDMYNKHYHNTDCLGKNVLYTDSMWFTSDEIEAFRDIWQRRLSAI
jgi:hypothetical protein